MLRLRFPLTLFTLMSLAGMLFAAKPGCAAAHRQYMETCAMCHGVNGAGYPAIHTPDFTDRKWQAQHNDAELIAAVTHGKQGKGRMPAWQGQLSPRMIDALVHCVVRGFAKK